MSEPPNALRLVEATGPSGASPDLPAPSRWRGLVVGLAVLLLLAGALGYGAWRFHERNSSVLATAERHRDFVPSVRVALVRASDDTMRVTLPATTLAYTAANIFARASGYIDKRNADIGDHVEEGELLAKITAPELDHQIAQAEATLDLNKASLRQNIANMDLARITWNRDRPLVAEGWTTRQQGSIDAQNLKALQAAVGVAEASVAAQEAQLRVLKQQKAYQSVVAPFEGVVTQRNVDLGDLVQADATTGTFMFTLQQTDVIRTWVYVPQDQAFGLKPGVQAIVRVPEMPGRTFPGKVTRIADALQPGTRTLLTEVDVPNPDGALAAGIYCTIELLIPRHETSLIVPAEAIVFDRDGLHVAVVEGGVARLTKVTVARDFGTEVEIVDGLKAGDAVIVNPSVNLVDGSKVAAQPIQRVKEASN